MKIYFDNCCFNRPFDDQRQIKIRLEAEAKLHIQEQVLGNQHELVWSYILEYENKYNPFEERRATILKWKNYAVIDVEENQEIIKSAIELQSKGIRGKDALHISCAVWAKCDVFLTTDEYLIKKLVGYKKVKVLNPISFILTSKE